jgi:hypothetical protein
VSDAPAEPEAKAEANAPVSALALLNRIRPVELAAVTLAGIVFFVFGDLLLQSGSIASHSFGDTVNYFVYSRPFAFAELANGNLPLWNPHTFSGTPFLGVFQTSVLYPPNFFYFFLPLPMAINLEFALHVFLMGLFTFGWARGRGLHPLAALVSAGIVAFGATTSLRVLAGALSVIDCLTWLPLLLLSIDELSKRVGLGWLLTGVLATTMMLLAGHPPTVYASGLTAGLYCVPALRASGDRLGFVGALAGLVTFAAMLSAIQLLAGFEVLSESVRQDGVSFEYATSFSFPPENLLGLLVPKLFGEPQAHTVLYFGRWYYWDDLAYIGLAGLIAALLGATLGRGAGRKTALALCIGLGVVAFGRYTPIYALLFDWVPGLNLIRAPSKFMFHSMLFAALLAGIGIDQLLRDMRTIRWAAWLSLGLAAALALCAWWIQPGGTEGWISPPIRFLGSLNEQTTMTMGKMSAQVRLATPAMIRAAVICAALAALFFIARKRREALLLVIAVGLLDVGLFAHANRGTSPTFYYTSNRMRPGIVDTYREAGQDRVFEVSRRSNLALYARGFGMWGYDPVVLNRYIEFIARTQNRSIADLDNVTGRHPDRFHPLFSMLRVKYVVSPSGKVTEDQSALPHFLLVGHHTIEHGAEAILDRMEAEDFDPEELVVLESEPSPSPAGGRPRGKMLLLGQSTDHMTIELDVDRAAILLVTDSYAKGWRATALPGSAQDEYQVLPANLVLRGIPVSAGKHRFRLEYAPFSFRLGRGITLASMALYAGALGWWAWRRRGGAAIRASRSG